MPSNSAAWLVEKGKPLEVKPAPYPVPNADEIVIKNGAVAINPVDWVLRDVAPPRFQLQYPSILGLDTAGEVAEVGSSVTRFKVGDRVLGLGNFMSKGAPAAAFQQYTVVSENVAAHIPSNISFEAASVIPLGFSTAAIGMYQKDHLGLRYPSVESKPTGQVLFIWGGATSVGSNGIQLGVASGYEVITTCSPKSFEYVKRLGASQAFDYSSETVVDDVVAALNGKNVAGVLDCIAVEGAIEACAQVLLKSESTRLIATVKRELAGDIGGVKVTGIFGATLQNNEVGKIVFEDYLQKALEEGKFIPAPDPFVVGRGLEAIQDGIDALKKGVSAQKVVIAL